MLVGLFVLLKLPTLALPYYWDEGGAYVGPALWLADHGLWHAIPGLHPPGQFYGHPPGIYLGLATLYRLFGHSLWLTHSVAVGLAAASLYLTFRIGHLIAGNAAGLLSALLLLLSPLFFAQAGMMHGDMTITALGLCAVLLYLRGRIELYWIAATALVCCKETGIGLVAAISAYHALFRFDRRRRLREALLLATPALVLPAYFGAAWAISGQLPYNPYFGEHRMMSLSLDRFRYTSSWIFERQGRWILVLAVAVGLRRLPRRRELALMLLLILPFWAAFSVIAILPRYLLPAFPFLCILAGAALAGLGERSIFIPTAALAGLAAIFAHESTVAATEVTNYEINLGYVQVVRVHAETAGWLEDRHADARIEAAWPMSMYLSQPRLGYVNHPLVVTDQRDADLIVWSAQGSPDNQEILARASAEKWREIRRFERGDKRAIVFAPPMPLQDGLDQVGTGQVPAGDLAP